MHSDSPITFKSLFRRNKLAFSQEDSWLSASISSLGPISGISADNLAEEILRMCSGHPIMSKIERVAIVRRMGGSNRLFVLSSANREQKTNVMPCGYSCFVNANGSLLSLRHGAVRFFGDAQNVVDHFVRQNLPPQRSIGRIARMNLGAGLCSGVFENGRAIGYIFVNGRFTERDLDEGATGVLLTQLLASAHAYYEPFKLSGLYWDLHSRSPDEYVGCRLSATKMSDGIRQGVMNLTGQGRQVMVTLAENKMNFLVSHGNICQIIARGIDVFHDCPIDRVHVTRSEGRLRFEVRSNSAATPLQAFQNLRIGQVMADARALGLGFECVKAGEFSVLVMQDAASMDPGVDYSVENP